MWQRQLEHLRREQGAPNATRKQEAPRPVLRLPVGPPPGWEPKAKPAEEKPSRGVVIIGDDDDDDEGCITIQL